MGLLEKIFRPSEAKKSEEILRQAHAYFQALSAYTPVFTSWGGAIYESEIVRAAIDARARHISKLKVETYGTANLPLQMKLKLGPSQFMTWSQFLYRLSTILDVNNTAFITPVFDEKMRITGVFPVLPQQTTIVEYKGQPWLRYQFSNGQYAAVELDKCAILTKHQYKNDFYGDSNRALTETMQLMHIQSQGIEEGVKNSATYRFMATLNNFSSAEDLANERERFSEKNLTSQANGGGLLLFPNTYKDIKQLETKPYTIDAQQAAQIRENIYNYFGVNEEILQNSATADKLDAFFNGCIEPFAIQLSEAMGRMLFSERERAQGSGLLVSANRLQYMSTSEKVQMTQQLLDRGVMSINESREIFNMSPVEGGDLRPIRGEYKPADNVQNTEEGEENEG